MFTPKIKLIFILATGLALINTAFYVQNKQKESRVLVAREISLNNRQPDRLVNDVFRKNILLTLAYMNGKISKNKPIDWNKINQPGTIEIRLDKNETFAFHEDVLREYQGKVSKTTQAHFNYQDGFVTDGYLYGDGICHLASLVYWAAKEAGLLVKAPTNHNFANIPQIPKEYGVSIFYQPGNIYNNALQNLYITNTHPKPIAMRFDYHHNQLGLSIIELE